MALLVLGCVAALSCLIFLLSKSARNVRDPREPPLISPTLPIVGHLVGMLRKGSRYYDQIAERYPELPIYTLGMPQGSLYVVTGPDLVQAVDRQPKIFSFNPIVRHFARTIGSASPETVQKLATYTPGRHGEGLNPEILRVQHDTLAPGIHLASMDTEMLHGVLDFLDTEGKNFPNGHEVALCAFFRELTTVVSTRAVYGQEHNPYESKALRDGLWDVYSDFARLGLNYRPDIIAPKGNSARTRIFHAMHKYYENDGLETASGLIQARYKVHKKYDLPQSDITQFDLGISFGLVANSAATMFWVIYYVYTHPEWLEDIRHEILSLCSVRQQLESNANLKAANTAVNLSSPVIVVNLAEVVEECGLLTSFITEVLRVQSTSASARVVMEDTLLEGKYLLKKGNFVLSPSVVMHRDENAWGPTAKSFNPGRFTLQPDPSDKQGQRHRPHKALMSAHRSWGGGINQCPGRYFAMHELISVLVVMVSRYDITPSTGSWIFPKTTGHIAASIMQPVKDVQVVIKERRDMAQWKFEWHNQVTSGVSSRDL